MAEKKTGAAGRDKYEPQLRDLFLFATGDCTFGVPAEEVDGTSEGKQPTPLPNAPRSILGVVYARGRMLTLIDPLALVNGEDSHHGSVAAIVSLRGDEQLALAAESICETITISSSDIDAVPDASGEMPGAIAGILRHGGEKITILDPQRLFAAAVYRKDRRRRRF